jgi:cell division protein FtsB
MKRESIINFFKILRKWWLLLAVILFFVYLMFFDKNSIMVRMDYSHEVDSLRGVIEDYKKQIESDSIKIESLKKDKSAIEDYAREKYGYKRADEDVFVIEYEKSEE